MSVDAAAARRFYCDVLRGRQLWPSERTAGRELWFQVGDAVVAVPSDPRDVVMPALLVVDDPVATAARCWDAGFTVRVRDSACGGTTLVVTDPFGRQLVLVHGGAATSAGRTASEGST